MMNFVSQFKLNALKQTYKRLFISVLFFILHSSLFTLHSFAQTADSTLRRNLYQTRTGTYQPSRTLKNDLLHTRLNLRFDWVRQHVIGTATLRIKPYFYPQNTLELDARGFDIKGIYLLDTLNRYDSTYKQPIKTYVFDTLQYTYADQKQIRLQLPRTYTRRDTFDIQVVYIAKPNELPTTPSRKEGVAISDDKGLYFINHDGLEPGKPRQIWTQGETQNSSAWFPTIDAPNEKMTQEIYLTVENRYRTLSNGRLVSSTPNPADSTRTDYWAQWKPHAPYLAMIAVGEFAIVTDSIPRTSVGRDSQPNRSALEISYYVEPKYESSARAIFGRTPAMMRFLEQLFGVPYPWDKYSQIIVRDFVSGAMENTSATVHNEKLQKDARQLIDENDDETIVHELAHHWFGDYVTCESWSNLPLNESFATYAEYLWFEQARSRDEADLHGASDLNQYLAEAETKQEPLIRPRVADREDMFDAHSYQKGGRVLHYLRKFIGDDAFFLVLRNYLNAHPFGTAEIADLRETVEAVTGEDMNWFFDQWFMRPGHPVLKVEPEFAPGKTMLKISQLQDTLVAPLFRLPLKVDVWTKGQKASYDVTIDRARQTLTFPTDQRPDLILFDADRRLVGTIDQPKNKRELLFQYYHANTYQDRYEAIVGLEDKAVLQDSLNRKMMIDALNDPFWKIRQVAVSNFAEYDGRQFSDIEAIIQSKARNDPKSIVRAEAITTLASFGDNANDPLFREALNDSSYAVVSVALDAYLIGKPGDAADIAARFEQVPNGDIITAVANFYANTPDPVRFEWFLEKMRSLSAQDQYNFLQVFGKYLIKSDGEVQRRAVPILETTARNEPAYFVRFGAYQVLGLLTDVEGVKAIRRDIRTNERDSRLKEMYEQLRDF
jgi:aminopeptidase N